MKNIIIVFPIIILFAALFSCQEEKTPAISSEARLNLANAYYTNGLYSASVSEYHTYLADYQIDANRRANTYYTIANIYFERINDYEKALEYYFKIKYLYQESNLQNDVSKRIVNCLERLQRSSDAARVVEKEAALDKASVEKSRPGAVLAKIGSREITQGDLDYQLSKLPPYLAEELKDKEKKKQYLQQYIGQELLYDSAKRKGLDKDKEVVDAAFRAQKALMAEKLLQDELKDQLKIDPNDMELYYMAHKDKYVEKDEKGNMKRQKTFREVAQQVAQDLSLDRQQQAYQKLINRLMKAQDVQIFESRIK